MQILIHLPRKSEADISPMPEDDLCITPKFYKRTGYVPVFYITTVDANGEEEKHVLVLSAANKILRVDKLVEVVPECDLPNRKRDKKSSPVLDEPDESEEGQEE